MHFFDVEEVYYDDDKGMGLESYSAHEYAGMFYLMFYNSFPSHNYNPKTERYYANVSNAYFDLEDIQKFLKSTHGSLRYGRIMRRLKAITDIFVNMSDTQIAMLNLLITG